MNLVVRHKSEIVFTHDGHWLHPLFALKEFLLDSDLPPEELHVSDKIIGRGAAVILAWLGVGGCHGDTLSRRAMPVLDSAGIKYSWGTLVDTLACRTESLITDNMPIDQGFHLLEERAAEAVKAGKQ